ncbi:MAG TPA: MMPL family transporter [Tepidisphaeraceae bacterium]|jgi:predicted exporter|nr:MMPL family transporter [Tepidisphaeraceae bacterium]
MSVSGGDRGSRAIWMGVGILALALSVGGWFRLRIDSSLEPLLPENSDARQTVLFLRDSSFASKIVLWFRLRGDGDVSELYAAADEAEKHLDPKLIKRVIHPPRDAAAVDQVFGLLDDAGELLNASDLSEVEKATAPDALRKRMRECYMQLLRPEGSFMQRILRKDPLGVTSRILSRLYALSKGMGYRVEVKNGRFVHRDGRQMMLLLETNATATSVADSKQLVASLRRISESAPAGVEITPICAQIHTEENQRVMERDIRWMGFVNGIVFLLLFLAVSRDWRVGTIFLLPLVCISMTLGLCALVHPTLSLIVIGVSITMAGSAVDYGIFVYTVVSTSKDRKADLRRIRRPLLISHLTTLGVVLAFVFSAIPAYRQLGWLTSVSLVVSLLAALFVLPKLIRTDGKILLLGSGMPLKRWGRIMVPMTFVGAMLLIVMIVLARKTNFNADIGRLDGISPSVRAAEVDFQKTWGRSDGELGMLVVTGKTRAQAEEANEKINNLMAGHFAEGDWVSLSDFWPSPATRRANLLRWRRFWSPDRIAALRRDLAAAGEPYGFSAEAFEPFFQILAQPPREDQSREIVSAVEDQFIARSGDRFQMLNYFPDTAQTMATVRDLAAGHPEAQIVSRRALSDAFARSARSETRLLVGVSAAFIILFLLALTRSVVKSVIIMLPAIVGLLAMLAVLSAMGLSMNVVTVVAAIVVLALTSDYGVFAVYAWENREPLFGQGMASVHLCALTTAAGTIALLFARHPALFLVGVSLSSGLVAGYLSALFVIPGILWLLDQTKWGKTA